MSSRASRQAAKGRDLSVGSRSHPLVESLKVLVLLLCCVVVAGPFIMVVATSFADNDQIAREGGMVLFPERPSLEAYRAILGGGRVTAALLNSIFVTVVGTLLALAVTSLLAYALSRRDLAFGRFLLMSVLATMLFSAGIIPLYLTVKSFGLLDSLWSLIVPVCVSAFNVIVMRAFFQGLPRELTEAAVIDGASEWKVFTRIVLPLSKPILAAIGLFYAVGFWNAFFSALLYLNDVSKYPITLVLREFLVNNAQLRGDDIQVAGDIPPPQPAMQMAILVIALLPIAVVYPFLQKHFTRGVLTGAVKG